MKHSYPLKYDKRTADYIDKWEEMVFKAPYVWNTEKIMMGLKKFYAALDREFPENYKIKKCVDVFDKDFSKVITSSASSASSAYLVSSASS